MGRFADEPSELLADVLAARPAALPTPDALSPEALQAAIGRRTSAAQADAAVDEVAGHIARNTRLTALEARSVVQTAMAGQSTQGSATSPSAAAKSASAAATAAAGPSLAVQFSQPAMLKPWARFTFAGLLFIPLLVSLFFTYRLARHATTPTHPVPGAVYVSLAIVAAFSVIGILVLVMGYGNVTINAGAPSPTKSA